MRSLPTGCIRSAARAGASSGGNGSSGASSSGSSAGSSSSRSSGSRAGAASGAAGLPLTSGSSGSLASSLSAALAPPNAIKVYEAGRQGNGKRIVAETVVQAPVDVVRAWLAEGGLESAPAAIHLQHVLQPMAPQTLMAPLNLPCTAHLLLGGLGLKFESAALRATRCFPPAGLARADQLGAAGRLCAQP